MSPCLTVFVKTAGGKADAGAISMLTKPASGANWSGTFSFHRRIYRVVNSRTPLTAVIEEMYLKAHYFR
jgi:hypothetical protein